MSQNLSSAAVVIGTLRNKYLNMDFRSFDKVCIGINARIKNVQWILFVCLFVCYDAS